MLDRRVVQFIKKHHILTLATVGDVLHCSNMFYAYIEAENKFVFTSSSETLHARQALENSVVAGSVVNQSRIVGRVQGLQFRGVMTPVSAEDESLCRKAYLRRFPYAAAMNLEIWTLTITFAKFTDNTLGFGKKLIWSADDK